MAGMETFAWLEPVDGWVSQRDRLLFSATVARHLVHRRAVAEVLLTDWCQVDAGVFVCAAQWSRSHSLYRIRHGRHDPLLLAETIRQVGLLLCHEAYRIPSEHRCVMDRMTYHVDPDGLRAGSVPAEIVLMVRVQQSRRRTRWATGLRLDVEFLRDEVPIGRGAGGVRCLGPLLYQRIRSPQGPPMTVQEQQPPSVPPREVGLLEVDDVVLGQCHRPGEWPLRILTTHPVLFDHPLDHVPGMLVLEGIRQSGRALLGWPTAQLTTCDVTFCRFIELGEPSAIRATAQQRSPARADVVMTLVQAGHTAAQGTVTITDTTDDGTTHPCHIPTRQQPSGGNGSV